jgi:hypothetical protein
VFKVVQIGALRVERLKAESPKTVAAAVEGVGSALGEFMNRSKSCTKL